MILAPNFSAIALAAPSAATLASWKSTGTRIVLTSNMVPTPHQIAWRSADPPSGGTPRRPQSHSARQRMFVGRSVRLFEDVQKSILVVLENAETIELLFQ